MGGSCCRNQNLQDFRIFRILEGDGLCGFGVAEDLLE